MPYITYMAEYQVPFFFKETYENIIFGKLHSGIV